MAFLVPATIQKRIIRYALSQLSFLDMASFDLDQLEGAWGRRTTGEIKDIPFKIDKLTELLKLPDWVRIDRAAVHRLRLTVPYNIWSQGIEVVIDGVDIRCSVEEDRAKEKGLQKGIKSNQPRDPRQMNYDPGGNNHAGLPSVEEMAQSFVAHQSESEKERLKSELAQHAQNASMEESSSSIDSDEDVGLGTQFSLPAVMADFLWGIGERLKVSLKNISFEVSFPLDIPTVGSVTTSTDNVSFRLTVDDIDLQGVQASNRPQSKSTSEPEQTMNLGNHRVVVKNVQGFVVSEPSLFAAFSAMSIPPSPTPTQVGSSRHETSSDSSRSIPRSTTSGIDDASSSIPSISDSQELAMSTSTILDAPPDTFRSMYHDPQPDDAEDSDEAALSESMHESMIYSRYHGFGSEADISQFDDYSSPDQSFLESGDMDSPQRSQHALEESGTLPQGHRAAVSRTASDLAATHFTEGSVRSRGSNRRAPPSRPVEPEDDRESTPTREEQLDRSVLQQSVFHDFPNQEEPIDSMLESQLFHDSRSISGSGASAERETGHELGHELEQEPEKEDVPAETANDTPLSTIESDPAESDDEESVRDLAQSTLFNTAEAQSLYQSARLENSVVAGVDMPGGWGDESAEDDLPEVFASLHESKLQHRRNDSDATIHGNKADHAMAASVLHESAGAKGDSSTGSLTASESTSRRSQYTSRVTNTALRRRLLRVDQIVVEIPVSLLRKANAGTEEQTASPEPAASQTKARLARMPGEMSLWEDTLSRLEKSTMRASFTASRQESFGSDVPDVECQISVNVGNITLENDMSLTKLLVTASQQLLASRGPAQPEESHVDGGSVPSLAWTLKVERLSWAFVDSMKSHLDSSLISQPETAFIATNTLLSTRALDLSISQKPSTLGSCVIISVGQYTFGYVDEPILQFESSSSNSDKSKTLSKDISIKIQNFPTNPPDIKISTAPLRVTLDLRRLDETFGWFGGLSGMIGLSNSVMSTTTIVEQKRTPKPSKVHFETASQAPAIEKNTPSEASSVKVTAVVNGIFIDLFGQASSLHVKTSPLKMVHRTEGIGMQIDKIDFEGPAIYESTDEAPIFISLGPLKVTYHQTPKENDLARLLGLLSPSVQQHEEEEADDDILVDTLIRQRRKGGVLRLNIDHIDGRVERLQELDHLAALGDELKKLSTVAKYLPEDDRPGAMILLLINKTHVEVEVSPRVGTVTVDASNLESACVTMPLLLLVGIDKIEARRGDEKLLGQVVPQNTRQIRGNSLESNNFTPMFRLKFIGNDLEPTIKLRLFNLCVEYHVTTVMAIMGISETASGEVVIAEMIHSVANLAETTTLPSISPESTDLSSKSSNQKPMKTDIKLRDCAIGLNPRRSPAKGLLVLSSTQLIASLPDSANSPVDGVLHLKRVLFMVVDDTKTLRYSTDSTASTVNFASTQDGHAATLARFGYVSTTDLSEAKVILKMSAKGSNGDRTMDVEVEDKLLVLDSCADSTQTMISIFAGLSPPMPPSEELRYRTEVMPVEDMLGSITGELVVSNETSPRSESGQYRRSQDMLDAELGLESYDFAKQLGYALPDTEDQLGEIGQSAQPRKRRGILNLNNQDFFVPTPAVAWDGVALEFDSQDNKYRHADKGKVASSPLRLRLRDVNLIWNLFDGYDWQHTRNVIGEAVADVEKRAAARKAHRRRSAEAVEQEEDEVIGDFLFNSVYIGVGAKDDPRDLARQINKHLADDDLETASYATPTTVLSNATSARTHFGKTKRKHLRVERSKHQKITFDLKGVSADVVVYPPGSGETQTSVTLRVHDLEIFDHIRTSTWKKFATYMHDYGARDVSTPMVVIELLNVKPVPDLPASELVMRVRILPLRLHVDQDAVDFLTRFFEFKDSGRSNAAPPSEPGEEPFIQRFEIFAVPVKLDFKPKRVDYAGLKSGKTTEFMNFIILDGSDMVLDHIIMYGISGFERLGKMLNDIWMPAIKQNQLPGVLAGLAPVRGIVNIGSGVKDLVMVPWQEYRKDGRIVRAIQKGAFAFAKNTTTELTKLGARVALGTQAVLQNAEDLLIGQAGGDDGPANVRNTPGTDEDKPQLISPYADQPLGVMAGLKGAYRHLERDMLYARDAVIAMPGEIRDSGSASGAARAVLRGAPTVVLRPAMGVTHAIGTAFMGATNALDKDERRRANDKYKRH